MAQNFRLVLLEEATPGMVLSDNLLDRHGKVLLPQGTTLNEKLIESLRRYEMEMIPVFREELTEDEKAGMIASRQARLDVLFRRQDYDKPEENANSILLKYLKDFRSREDT